MPYTHEVPGEWVSWHDPVYRTQGGDLLAGAYYHPSDATNDGGLTTIDAFETGLLVRVSGDVANIRFQHVFDSPVYPSDNPSCGFYSASVGRSGTFDWVGTCFVVGSFSPGGGESGSSWSINNSGRTSPSIGGGLQTVDWSCRITGWLLRPWKLFHGYDNQWLDDDTLAATLDAAQTAAIAALPDNAVGYQFEWESNVPRLVGLEWAPDEPYQDGFGNPTNYTGALHWIDNPRGWGYYKTADPDAPGEFAGPGVPGDAVDLFNPLAVYDGGEADWQPVPDEWLPTQIDDPDAVAFVEDALTDEEVLDRTLVLTTALEDFVIQEPPAAAAVLEGQSAAGGRSNQVLAFRARWELPRFRIVATLESNVIPPRRIRQRGDGLTGGARSVKASTKTRQGGNRTIGGIL